MAAGYGAAYSRVATVIEAITLTAHGGVTTFRQWPNRLTSAELADTGAHRRFHVLLDGMEPPERKAGRYAGSLIDDWMRLLVQVGYYEGGGDKPMPGPAAMPPTNDRQGIDQVAMIDLDILQQRLEDPANYDQANTGIQQILWTGTQRLPPGEGSRKRIYGLGFRVWTEHARLAAA